jgi:hypothetical protein
MTAVEALPLAFQNDLPEAWAEIRMGNLVSRIEAGKNLRCIERPPAKSERGIVKIRSHGASFWRMRAKRLIGTATSKQIGRSIRATF